MLLHAIYNFSPNKNIKFDFNKVLRLQNESVRNMPGPESIPIELKTNSVTVFKQMIHSFH